jgi:hypothetical protein
MPVRVTEDTARVYYGLRSVYSAGVLTGREDQRASILMRILVHEYRITSDSASRSHMIRVSAQVICFECLDAAESRIICRLQ